MSTMTASLPVADEVASTGELVRPLWRRIRFWLAVGVLIVVSALFLATVQDKSNKDPLDPDSYTHAGSAALAQLLQHYGTEVHRSTSLSQAAQAGGTVLVAFADAYSDKQLAQLRAGASRLVLLAPTGEQLDAIGAPLQTIGHAPVSQAGCDWPGALAAGRVSLPDAVNYLPHQGFVSCYGGAVMIGSGLVVLGTDQLLTNKQQAQAGVTALAVNAISADRTVHSITWLMPGADADQVAQPSIWSLFPGGVHRGVLFLIPLALVLMFWRGRRFGPVVSEPLPVVVRAAELVEGHGRLYLRAGAREQSAAALRAGAWHRLAAALGTDDRNQQDTIRALAERTGWGHDRLADALLGRAPADDPGLAVLAAELDRLEHAVQPGPPDASTTGAAPISSTGEGPS